MSKYPTVILWTDPPQLFEDRMDMIHNARPRDTIRHGHITASAGYYIKALKKGYKEARIPKKRKDMKAKP